MSVPRLGLDMEGTLRLGIAMECARTRYGVQKLGLGMECVKSKSRHGVPKA